MKSSKLSYAATLLALLLGNSASAQEQQDLERCNIFTSDVCFGIDWTKATSSDLESIDPNIYDSNGRTLLHWAAARSNSAQLIQDLIDAGFPVDVKDGADATPLHVAVEGRNARKSVVKILLDAGADIHAKSMEDSILHTAARKGEPWLIKTLLSAGANPNALDFDNFTPLYSAVFTNPNPEIAQLLISAGSDVNHRAKSEERGQQAAYRPLHAAAKGTRNPEIIRTLVQAGAVVDELNRDGYTPLHVAADSNRTPEVIQAFAEAGADINARNKDGHTPLHLAAFSSYPEMLGIFIAAGADVNAKNNDGLTPLHFAAIRNGDPAVLTELIEAGAEPYLKDNDGKTAFEYAKKNEELRSTDGDGYRMLELFK